jgi:hypothetical protein
VYGLTPRTPPESFNFEPRRQLPTSLHQFEARQIKVYKVDQGRQAACPISPPHQVEVEAVVPLLADRLSDEEAWIVDVEVRRRGGCS